MTDLFVTFGTIIALGTIVFVTLSFLLKPKKKTVEVLPESLSDLSKFQQDFLAAGDLDLLKASEVSILDNNELLISYKEALLANRIEQATNIQNELEFRNLNY